MSTSHLHDCDHFYSCDVGVVGGGHGVGAGEGQTIKSFRG